MIELPKIEIPLDPTTLYRDESKRDPTGITVLVGARDVGPVRATLPIVDALRIRELNFLTDGKARVELLKKRPHLSRDPLRGGLRATEINPDVILTAGDVSPGIDNMLAETYKGSKSATVWLEDTPGSLENREGPPPRLVYCSNPQSQATLMEQHPDIPVQNFRVLGFNPTFLEILSEEPRQLGTSTRKILGLSEEDIVITFIGSKSADIPYDPAILRETAEVLEELQKEHGMNFKLIRRDHPGEPEPKLYDEAISGYEIINMRKDSNLIDLISTSAVCCVSNLLVGAASTVFWAAAFRGKLRNQPGALGTLVLQRQQPTGEQRDPLINSGGSLVAYSRSEFKSLMYQILTDLNLQQTVLQAQSAYIPENPAEMRRRFERMLKEITELAR